MATPKFELDPVYRNRSAGVNVDKIGNLLVDVGKSLQSAWTQSVLDGTFTGWRRHGAGDGTTLNTTLDANIWVGGSSGDGYKNDGTAWSTGDGAGSWSNVRAWQRWVFWKNGVATTHEMMAQRAASTGPGNETTVNWGVTLTGFSGTPTGNSPYPTGSYHSFGLQAGATPNAWNTSSGLNFGQNLTTSPTITISGTYSWQIWRDVGARGFGLVFYESSGGDRGMTVFCLEYGEAATADDYPFILAGGNWQNILGGDSTYTAVSNFASGTAITYVVAYNGGAWYTPRQEQVIPPASGNYPPGITAQPAQDLDGNYSLIPLGVNLDNYPSGTTWVRKGIIRDCYTVIQGTSAHVFPQRVQPVNGGGKQWVILGGIAFPWDPAAGAVNWGSSPAVETNWRIWPQPSDTPDTAPPAVTLVSPSDLSGIARDEPIVIEVDDDRGIEMFIVLAVYPTIQMVEGVYDGDDPDLPTAYTVTPSVVGGKQRYSILRTGGWPAPGFLRVKAIDGRGNKAA